LLQQLSLSLRYLVSLYTALWYRDSIVTLTLPATTQEAVTPIILYGVTIDQELEEIQIHWIPGYLPYYIGDGLIAPTSTEFIRAFLETYQDTEEDADK